MQEALQRAKECLREAQDRQRDYTRDKRRELEFQVGDEVLLSTKKIILKNPGTHKLMPRFIGPLQVQERKGKLAYKLKLPDGMKMSSTSHC